MLWEEETPVAQRKLTFFDHSHSIEYFCKCKIHVGGLYLVEINSDVYKAVCRAGKNSLVADYPDKFSQDNFMTVPVKFSINV